jgi:uncharacterized membrane protein
MELILKDIAGNVALVAEIICVLCIAIGGSVAVIDVFNAAIRRELGHRGFRRKVFKGFAVWIVLALEFALGADIVRTAIAPTWNDIGQLAAIAVIRTGLNFFLERDLEAMEPIPETQPETA